jgi:PAS domain-containing protein
MPNVNIKTPNWLRQMEIMLEELNEGVVIVDGQLRVVFANEALARGLFPSGTSETQCRLRPTNCSGGRSWSSRM